MCAIESVADRSPVPRLTEEQLRRLLETTKAVPWSADARTWQFIYVGPQAADLLGFPVEQWYEKDFWARQIHPDDRAEAVGYCQTSSTLYTDFEFEYRMIAADGRSVWVHDLVHVVQKDQSPHLLHGFMIDITDRKAADQAVRDSAQQIRLIADSIPALVAYVDTDQRYRFNNAKFRDWFGIPAEEAHGRRIQDVLGETYHQARPFVEAALSGQPCKFELEMSHRDKGLRQMEANYLPHRSLDGEVLGFYVMAYDITDRKRADQALREGAQQIQLIADAIPALVAYVDNELRYKFNNAAYLDWFGISAEELRGKKVQEVLGDTFRQIRSHAEAALSGKACKFELELPHREKGLRQIEGSLLPHRNVDDEIEGIYALIYDVTERKLADEERRQHQAELAHLSRVATMGEFAAALAHELNQPLAAILANARAAERFLEQGATESADLDGALKDIAGAAKRAGDMIRRLRALMSKDDVDYQPLEINETIRGIETFIQAEALRCNVELRLDLATGLPQIQGNPIELQQVILNLVHNGLESMEQANDGDGTLTIRTDRHESGSLLVVVEDSGPRLDEGVLELMFEPFYSTRDEGLGIGLSLSRSIIKAHGGELWATANLEGGLTIQFTVPYEEPSAT